MQVKNKFLNNMVIYQDINHQSFTMDSLLLGNFATINKKVTKIVDLCAGNAPVALYLSTRTNALIDSVELQETPCISAKESIKDNNLSDRLNIYNENVKGISKILKADSYDLVTVNPPYFEYTEDTKVKDKESITLARFEKELKLSDLLKEASLLLKTKGYFAIIYRPERLTDLLSEMRNKGLEPKRLQFIRPKNKKVPKHVLVEGIKTSNTNGLIVMEDFVIYNDDDTYKEDALELYNRTLSNFEIS